MINRFIPFAFLLLLPAAPLSAQQPDPPGAKEKKEEELREEVEVVGHRKKPGLEVKVERAGAEMDRVEIKESGSWNVLDAIRYLRPSTFVTRRSLLGYGLAQGAGGLVSVRGVGGLPNTAVLVARDGVPNRMGLFGHPLQDTYMTEGLERVELLEGASSDLFGGSALAGVINLVSRRREREGMETEIQTRFGRYDTTESTFAHGARYGRFDYYASGGYRETGGHVENNGFRQRNVSFHGGWHLDPVWGLSLDLRGGRFSAEDPFNAGTSDRQEVSRRGGVLTLHEEREDVRGRASFYYEWGDHAFTDGWDSQDFTAGLSLSRVHDLGGGKRLALGFDWARYGGEAWVASRTVYRGEHHQTETSGFARLALPLGAGFHAVGGARLARGTEYDFLFLPSIGVAWQDDAPPWKPAVRLGWTRGFRAPTINELYFPMPASNSDLEEETMETLELAGTVRRGLFTGELVLFRIHGRDAIVRQGPPPPFSIANGGDYRHSGVEAIAALGKEKYGFRVGGAYLDHEGISPGAFRTRLIWSIYAGSGPLPPEGTEWKVRLRGESVKDLWGQPGSESHKEDFTTLDLWGSLGLGSLTGGRAEVELTAGIENLTDADWYEIGDLGAPGRAGWVGLRVAF